MSDDKKKMSFKDFAEKQIDEVIIPTGLIQSPDDQEMLDDEHLPVIFATVHHRSESRPNGWTPAMIEAANIVGNEHILGPAKSDDPEVQAEIDKIKGNK